MSTIERTHVCAPITITGEIISVHGEDRNFIAVSGNDPLRFIRMIAIPVELRLEAPNRESLLVKADVESEGLQITVEEDTIRGEFGHPDWEVVETPLEDSPGKYTFKISAPHGTTVVEVAEVP